MYKKGVTAQTFTFIFALILMALILGYGVKSLVRLKAVSEDVEIGDFVFRIRDQVDAMYSFEIGSSKEADFFLPKKVERVCFFNSGESITAVGMDEPLRQYVESAEGKNMLVMPSVFAQNVFSIDHLRSGGEEHPLCFATTGKLHLSLETVLGPDGKVYVEVRR